MIRGPDAIKFLAASAPNAKTIASATAMTYEKAPSRNSAIAARAPAADRPLRVFVTPFRYRNPARPYAPDACRMLDRRQDRDDGLTVGVGRGGGGGTRRESQGDAEELTSGSDHGADARAGIDRR